MTKRIVFAFCMLVFCACTKEREAEEDAASQSDAGARGQPQDSAKPHQCTPKPIEDYCASAQCPTIAEAIAQSPYATLYEGCGWQDIHYPTPPYGGNTDFSYDATGRLRGVLISTDSGDDTSCWGTLLFSACSAARISSCEADLHLAAASGKAECKLNSEEDAGMLDGGT